MPIVRMFDGCQDKSEPYRAGYLAALLGNLINTRPWFEWREYIDGYTTASIRRDKARAAQGEFKFKGD